MDGLDHWNDIIDAHPVLPWQEQVELAHQRDAGGKRGQDALDKLILHNLRAVVQRVERMNCRAELKADLMSAGVIGLQKAASRWKPMQKDGHSKPAPFPAYAFLYIKEMVIKEAKKNWHDDLSIDGIDEDSADDIVGSAEDSHDYLDSTVLDVLKGKERIIFERLIIQNTQEDPKDLGLKLNLKPMTVRKLFYRAVSKISSLAA